MGKDAEMKIMVRMTELLTRDKTLTIKQIHELQSLATKLKKLSNPTQSKGRKLNNENRATQIVIRVSYSELDAVKRYAKDEGFTISELIRDRVPELVSA